MKREQVMIDCPSCGGSGSLEEDIDDNGEHDTRSYPCERCEGTGQVDELDDNNSTGGEIR